MRCLFAVLICVTFLVGGEPRCHAQPAPDKIKEIIRLEELFRGYGIFVYPHMVPDKAGKEKQIGTVASFLFPTCKSLDGIEKLALVPDLTSVHASLGDDKLTNDFLDRIGKLPKTVKELEISINCNSNADLKKLAAAKHIQRLYLAFPDIDDTQVRQLHALKDLKQLKHVTLAHLHAPPKLLEELKRALPNVEKIDFDRIELAIPTLRIEREDSALVNLKKEKLNAAVLGLNDAFHKRFEPRVQDEEMIADASRRVTAALADLNDPGLTMKVVNAQVDLLGKKHEELRQRFTAGSIAPETYYRARYEYLDAQILQMRFKKQSEAK
jgi:hypothetical protein